MHGELSVPQQAVGTQYGLTTIKNSAVSPFLPRPFWCSPALKRVSLTWSREASAVVARVSADCASRAILVPSYCRRCCWDRSEAICASTWDACGWETQGRTSACVMLEQFSRRAHPVFVRFLGAPAPSVMSHVTSEFRQASVRDQDPGFRTSVRSGCGLSPAGNPASYTCRRCLRVGACAHPSAS